jgi:protein phosphatase
MKSTQIDQELKVGMGSHEGLSGKHNEDSLGTFAYQLEGDKKIILGVVADGVGGQIAGEVASRLAVEAVDKYFKNLSTLDNINRHLEEAINTANKAVYLASQENSQYRGMSTTMAITAIISDRLYTAHVGDSRIYLFRDRKLRQISTDHTWAQEAIEAGLLTREQAKTHPNRNVIRRHLGGSPEVEVDHRLVLQDGQSAQEMVANQGTGLRVGDTLLICTDGLTDMISDASVYESIYSHYVDLSTATNELIKKANEAGGKDNITVLLLQKPPVEALPPLVPKAQPITQTAAASAASAAAASRSATASQSAMAVTAADPAPTKAGGGRGIAFILAGGAFAVLILIVIAGIAFVIFSGGGDDPTPTPESVPVVAPDGEPTVSSGAPATAGITTAEATEEAAATSETDATPQDNPELIPTLRATRTLTPIPPTATLEPTPTPTPSETPSSGGGRPGGPPRPRPTSPPPPPD